MIVEAGADLIVSHELTFYLCLLEIGRVTTFRDSAGLLTVSTEMSGLSIPMTHCLLCINIHHPKILLLSTLSQSSFSEGLTKRKEASKEQVDQIAI